MKKKIIIIVSIIVLLILAVSVAYLIDKNRMANNKPVIFSTWGYSYVPPINLPESEIKSAILDYVVKKGDAEKHHSNAKTFANMEIYFIEEKEDFKLFNIYAWVLEEKYYLENNEIKKDGGSSIPYKFVVENIDGKYIVTNSRMPRDGSYYADDMKDIFPTTVRNDMDEIQTDGTMDKLINGIQQQKELYFKTSEKVNEQVSQEAPPDLFIYTINNNEEKAKALRGTYSWEIIKGEFTQSLNADSVHPTDFEYQEENTIKYDSSKMIVESEQMKISAVNIYALGSYDILAEEIHFNDNTIGINNLEVGEYVLEIIADYPQGRVSYGVKISNGTEEILDEELVLLSDDGIEFKLNEDMFTIDKEAVDEREGRGDGFHWKEYTYEDIFVKALISDDNSTYIILISTVSNKYKTPRGIKVGDSLQKLKEKYPEDLTKANSDKICYVYEPQGVGFKRIYFYIENDIITRIIIEDGIDG